MNRKIKRVNLSVHINGEVFCGIAETNLPLLENIENMNINIRSSCRRGRCGSCKIKLIDGTLDESISYKEEYVLSCASYLETDAEVLIEY